MCCFVLYTQWTNYHFGCVCCVCVIVRWIFCICEPTREWEALLTHRTIRCTLMLSKSSVVAESIVYVVSAVHAMLMRALSISRAKINPKRTCRNLPTNWLALKADTHHIYIYIYIQNRRWVYWITRESDFRVLAAARLICKNMCKGVNYETHIPTLLWSYPWRLRSFCHQPHTINMRIIKRTACNSVAASPKTSSARAFPRPSPQIWSNGRIIKIKLHTLAYIDNIYFKKHVYIHYKFVLCISCGSPAVLYVLMIDSLN